MLNGYLGTRPPPACRCRRRVTSGLTYISTEQLLISILQWRHEAPFNITPIPFNTSLFEMTSLCEMTMDTTFRQS